ncbi:hypothetical protein TREMEDRAFT_64957 [Tremella mesenterica DSM 1558]|uniref:uncharacterized protein n=1 Tax=Tremella mesenterica (strain ATCC 24925 / CBS 8224 / DSM 1558 / NBRC 9311 / NRRL Y-6157 / RJB 2259-6 / UBC 559-6) TaxID=578456 RepID=UPI0003F4A4CE|nr:uncharacterized protein TREMEDRAFT_64957 [Tremella mesenterica DSM 1558]EIW67088.1 hypothetical protein TREMEDRAFT_64957 [Tremella mesenterica DSM 1558]
MDAEEDLTRIWALVGQLSEQLQTNRALVLQLKAKSENVKGQATHVGTGFPLRRFNLDISNGDEEFTSELEQFAAHLVLENQYLQNENKQLNQLLKEYEQTLETVMGKFRGVAFSSQQHDLSLHSYYTSLLQQLQTAHSSAQLHDNTSLSLLLTRLSTLLRSALRSLGGEETDMELVSQLPGLLMPDGHVKFDSPIASPDHSMNNNNPILPNPLPLSTITSNQMIHSDPSNQPIHPNQPNAPIQPIQSNTLNQPIQSNKPNHPLQSGHTTTNQTTPTPKTPLQHQGFLPGSKGGYAGNEGQQDWALEREAEILRLEFENSELRKLLGLAEGSGSDVEEEAKHILDFANFEREDGRKKSLTIEELQADAEKEEEEAKLGVKLDQAMERAVMDVSVSMGGDEPLEEVIEG